MRRNRRTGALRSRAALVTLAVLAAGLGIGGTTQRAEATPGVFNVPGQQTTFGVPSWVTSMVVVAVGGAGQSVSPSGVTGVGAHGALVTAVVAVNPATDYFDITVGRHGGAGGARGSPTTATQGGAGGGESHANLCKPSCSPKVFAGGGGGQGGSFPGGTDPNTGITLTTGLGGAGGTAGDAATAACGTGNAAPGNAGGAGAVATTTVAMMPVPAGQGPGAGGPPGTCTGPGVITPGSPSTRDGAGSSGGDGSNGNSTGGGAGGGGGGGFFGAGAGGAGGRNAGGGGGGAGSSFNGGTAFPPVPLIQNANSGSTTPGGFLTGSLADPLVVFYYVPGPPTNVSATRANASAVLTWNRPADIGGATPALTSYIVTTNPPTVATTIACPCGPTQTATISGLANGTTYTFNVKAVNFFGEGPNSAPSNAVTPGGVPDAPAAPVAVAGNQKATVSWVAPANNGSPITSYTVRSSGGQIVDVEGSVTTATITGLTNGQSYTFTVEATNANGTGPKSPPSNAVVPGPSAPAAPTGVTATPGNTQATVTWTPSADDGGSAITSQTVTSQPGGHTAVVGPTVTSAVVTGLTNGVSYTFTVTATNAIGTSPPSAPSNAVIPKADLPSAPTNVVATAGNASATVTWTPPASNGGSPLTGYVITTDPPGGTTPPIGPGATSAVVSSLNNGTTYTIMVAATNSSGTGPAGTSNPVTPSGGPPPPNRTFLSTNFDSGIPNGWTNTFSSSAIKWHVTSACAAAHSGLAAYYGIDSTCTYNDGTSNIGTLQTPLLTGVPQNATLTVWSKRLVESCTGCTRDRTQIRVNYGSGFSDVYYRDASNPSNGVYEQLVIPLHSTTGQVQIRFVFNTTSTLNNNFFGWAIDDVVVQSP